MALNEHKITTYADNIKNLSDNPSDEGMSASQLKDIFDGRTDKEVKTQFNALIDALVLLGVEKLVQTADIGEIKHIRFTAGLLEVSPDGETWQACYTHPQTHSADMLIDGTEIKAFLAEERIKLLNALAIDNTVPFTPSSDYHPVHKKYLEEYALSLGSGDMLKAVYDADNDGIVDTAKKDALGNVINETYATISELNQKVDLEDFNNKADKSVMSTAILTAAGWVGAVAPYTQEVAIAGLGANSNGVVILAKTATLTARNQASAARLNPTAQREGYITITADGIKPTTNIDIAVLILG